MDGDPAGLGRHQLVAARGARAGFGVRCGQRVCADQKTPCATSQPDKIERGRQSHERDIYCGRQATKQDL